MSELRPDYSVWRAPATASRVSLHDEPVLLRAEAVTAVVVTAFSTLLGGLLGVVWYALAPRIGIVAVANGSGATMKSLISDDVWLAMLGGVAGLICVGALLVVAPRASRGPGAMAGLGIGGLLGTLVAARVGHLLGHPHLTDALQTAFPDVPMKAINYYVHLFDFSLRAKAALVAWPFAAVLLNSIIVGVRPANQPTRAALPAYPGSS